MIVRDLTSHALCLRRPMVVGFLYGTRELQDLSLSRTPAFQGGHGTTVPRQFLRTET